VLPPPPTAADKFATLIRWLSLAVAAMMGGDRLPLNLIGLITDRLRRVNQLFARIANGRFFPRRRTARPPGRPPPPDKLPRKFGWLLPLVPEAVGYRGQLENLLRDPEMAALMAAAPAPMGRALRPLCRMLGLEPPPILAPPERKPRPTPPRPAPPPTPPAAGPEKPPPPQPPPWMRGIRRRPWSPARIRGAPDPA
jgi:hypothetical protein